MKQEEEDEEKAFELKAQAQLTLSCLFTLSSKWWSSSCFSDCWCEIIRQLTNWKVNVGIEANYGFYADG